MRKFDLTLSQAVEGYVLERRVELKATTLENYGYALQKFQAHFASDPPINNITAQQVNAFLFGFAKRSKPLSMKSLLNIHTVLSSLWTWATREGYAAHHVVRAVPAPNPEKRAIVPYTKEDVKGMLEACGSTRSYIRPGKRECANSRPTAMRDQAVVRMLLDTGIRASELCDLRLEHLDAKNQRVKVFGKGSKERIIRVGRRTTRAIWRYLTARPDARLSDPLFVATGEVSQPMTRSSLYHLVRRLGDRAKVVPAAYPHRFRHTFAVSFLRNGGDVFSLQSLLGHSSLEMVHRYVALAQTDTENAHRRASPVDNWRL